MCISNCTSRCEEEQRIQNPHVHYVDMSPRLYELKMNMLHSSHAGKER